MRPGRVHEVSHLTWGCSEERKRHELGKPLILITGRGADISSEDQCARGARGRQVLRKTHRLKKGLLLPATALATAAMLLSVESAFAETPVPTPTKVVTVTTDGSPTATLPVPTATPTKVPPT